ncbi:hypothetical protein H0A65_16985, partial [Alcaligenaceae bacterium]|nr:hypothetical protein [Alcaligenaceae bacterium]
MALAPDLLFNLKWYLDHNPDVADALESGEITDAYEHFLQYGKTEGRSSSPLFNVEQYLIDNPDVAEAVENGEITAYDHFIQYGASEGRTPSHLFDAAFYLSQNPDVESAVENGDMTAIEHFLLYGQSEPRPFSPSIDLGAYLAANPDIEAAVEAGQMSALEHLMLYGASEGRDLGNGVDMSIFADDATFQDALEAGDVQGALDRVAEVAPFLPTFVPPTGWEAPADTPIPVDFVPPEGTLLVIPPSVVVPPDTELPDTFEPPADTGGGGGTPATFTVTESGSVLTVEGTATDAVVVDLSANTVTRAGNPVTVEGSPNLTGVIATNYSGNVTAQNAAVDATLTDVDAYTLLDTLENLTAADAAVLEGATSYTLSDESLTAAGLTDVAVADLATEQAAALTAVRENAVVAGATNGDTITVNKGTYSLTDSLENLADPANADVVALATALTLTETTFETEAVNSSIA